MDAVLPLGNLPCVWLLHYMQRLPGCACVKAGPACQLSCITVCSTPAIIGKDHCSKNLSIEDTCEQVYEPWIKSKPHKLSTTVSGSQIVYAHQECIFIHSARIPTA